MGQFGWSTGGSSGAATSRMFQSLPFRGYRDRNAWAEEFINAVGDRWDEIYNRFVKAQNRANLLDPSYTPTEIADSNMATATVAPNGAVSSDTMVDVLLFVALGIYPADSNLTVAQKQQLVQVGWNALRRKGNRIQLLRLAAIVGDGVAVGWTVPPFNFSVILPDGAPTPGYGAWVQPTNATSESSRPWILAGVRNTLARVTPAFINLGVGYSQFRAGYSSAGETIFPAGARINIIQHEHFDTWATGVPTSWTSSGAGTLTQSTTDASINWEFTGNAAVFDLTSAANGVLAALSQTAFYVNNQLMHRFQLDYKYTNAQAASTLLVQITDVNPDGNTYYWNPTAALWSKTAYNIAVPPSAARGRYACDIVPQASSATTSTRGTQSLGIQVSAQSDGTTTTQQKYTLYRVGLYEKFNLANEENAGGERTLDCPLIDAGGWASTSRAAGGVLIEMVNAQRSAYKYAGASVSFPYSAALNGRGFLSHSTWTNLLKGSNAFTSDWTTNDAIITNNAVISPLVGETVASASQVTATNISPYLLQATGINPASKSYVGGVWIKKLSSDSSFTDVAVEIDSGGVTAFQNSCTITQAQGWTLIPVAGTFGAGDTLGLNFRVFWGQAVANGQIAVADAYLYDVTGKSRVLYPPVVRTTPGSTATLGATTCEALTASTNVNVLHPLLQRTLVSVVRGSLSLTVVPTFDASSQPASQVIFDVAQDATHNRVLLRIDGSGNLQLIRYDNSSNIWQATLALTGKLSPASGQVTWLRNRALAIRCIWDENSTMLSAGSANASGTKPGSWAPLDASVKAIGIGNDYLLANPFDGQVTGVQVLQLGAPTT